MISREEAVDILTMLEESEILNEEIQDKLGDISTAIEKETEGLHIWGSEEDDWTELYVAYREDHWTDELKARLEGIDKKYRYTPSPFECHED